jgi:hypothetical protein
LSREINVLRSSRPRLQPIILIKLTFKTKKQAGVEAGLWILVFAAPDSEIALGALDSRQSPFVESEEHPAPHVDFLAPCRLATRAWVVEKRDYRR